MVDHIYAGNRLAQGVYIAHVPDHQISFRREIGRRSVGMNLRIQVVKDADMMSLLQKCIRQMGADKTRSACNQYIFLHPSP